MDMIAFLLVSIVLIGAIILIAQVAGLSSRVRDLEREVTSLRSQIADLFFQARTMEEPASSRGALPPTAVGERTPQRAGPLAESVPGAGTAAPPAPPPPAQTAEVPARPTAPPAPVIKRPSRTREEWEALIGGKLLNRIGALALILAVGFFLKYAFDTNLITETMRVVIGGAIGLLCLITAARSARKGFQIFAQGLVGAGIAILYVSVYASFNYYSLVSQPVALLLMSAVTVIAFTQAFRYDTLAVSLLGLIGGFLTPYLLSTGEVNTVGLFTYVAILDAGLIFVLLRKNSWIVLEPLALAGTYVIYFTWYLGYFVPEDLVAALLSLTLFWALFHSLDLIRIRQEFSPWFDFRRILAAAHSVVLTYALFLLLRPKTDEALAGGMLAFAALYSGSAFFGEGVGKKGALVFGHFILTAIILLTLATLVEFKSFTLVIVWSLECLLIVFLGLQFQRIAVWIPALVLYPMVILTLIGVRGSLAYTPLSEFTFCMNERATAFAVLALSLAGTGLFFRWKREGSRFTALRQPLFYAWVGVLLIGLTVEINDLFRLWMIDSLATAGQALDTQRYLTLSVLWSLAAIPLLLHARRAAIDALVAPALGAYAIAVVLFCLRGLFFSPIEEFRLLLNPRATAAAVLGISFAAAGLVSRRETATPPPRWLRELLQYGWLLTLFVGLTIETNDLFRSWMTGRNNILTEHLGYQRTILLAAVWALAALPLLWQGLRARLRPVFYGSLWMIILAACLAVLRGLTYSPIEEFHVAVNLRALTFLAVFAVGTVGAVLLARHGKTFDWVPEFRSTFKFVPVILLLVLCSAETRDLFQREIAQLTVIGSSAVVDEELTRLENLQQLSLSTVWLLFSIALMVFGLWRRARSFRLQALVLFGMAILKIFIYDLSFLETLYRIFSFVGLGVILLAVSYLYQRYRNVILEPSKEGDASP